MLFADYYNKLFREDLAQVLDASPPAHAHEPDEVTIQPKTISEANLIVQSWAQDRRLLFAAGLFLTVLADQVCYTHFADSYPRFRSLTKYPKWRGDCPGGCLSHIHPGAVFRTVGRSRRPTGEKQVLPFELLPDDVISTMER